MTDEQRPLTSADFENRLLQAEQSGIPVDWKSAFRTLQQASSISFQSLQQQVAEKTAEVQRLNAELDKLNEQTMPED